MGKALRAADSRDNLNACSLRVSVSASIVRDDDATGWEEDDDGPAVKERYINVFLQTILIQVANGPARPE